MYIVLEGVVGVGKTTQSKLLQQYLQDRYPEREVLLVREPGGTLIAEAIRKTVQGTDFGDEVMHPLTDVYLYAAARAQLLYTVVKPALKRGAIVVSDRSFVTSLVYQGYTQGLGIESVREANKQIVQDCMPDIVVFFDLPVAIGYERTFDSTGDKREQKPRSFFEMVHAGFELLGNFEPLQNRFTRLDAIGSVEEVAERLQDVTKKLSG